MAAGEDALLEYVRTKCLADPVPEVFAEKLIAYVRTYFVTGGMPAALSVWFATKNFSHVEEVQKNLLASYENDFAKHAPGREIPKLRSIWDSIPAQLGRENKKFMYGHLKKGGRAKEYEDALHWLKHAGLMYQIVRASAPGLPITAYDDPGSFKLFTHDVGLLRVKSGLSYSALAEGNRLFTEFKGALTENFALTEMIAAGFGSVRYWTSDSQAEVDFLIQAESHVLPMEVKSSVNMRSRSLSVFRENYHPHLMLRSSLQNLRQDGDILNIPLYCLFYMNEILHTHITP